MPAGGGAVPAGGGAELADDAGGLAMQLSATSVAASHFGSPGRVSLYKFHAPLSPVGHVKNWLLELCEMVPSDPTLKPGVGWAPASHCHWEVGGVRMHPLPFPSMRPTHVS